jgi:uncharacterized protein (DUF1501 family)
MSPALVVIFLRGGADGLALVPPYADPLLVELRPTIASALPDDNRAAAVDRVVDIDGHLGLHPALAPLSPLIRAGELAIVHATGSDDETRSHFEAQDRMERAGLSATSSASGFLARHLASRPGPAAGPLAAISFGAILPESVRGHSATAVASLRELHADAIEDAALVCLSSLYDGAHAEPLSLDVELRAAGRDAVLVSRELASLGKSERDARFPDSPLGDQLAGAAALLDRRSELGIEVITIDHGGWDTHFLQGPSLSANAADLAKSLSAFREVLADGFRDTTVLVLTEFGRRCGENVSLGTDHGRGGVAFVAAGRLARGGIFGPVPSLAADALEGPGDLRVLTDYRVIVADVVEHALGNPRVADVLPGIQKSPRLGLFAAR